MSDETPGRHVSPEPGAATSRMAVSPVVWIGVGVALAAAIFFISRPSAELQRARELCAAIPAGNLLTASSLLNSAVAEFPGIGQTMREECPEVVEVLLDRANELEDVTSGRAAERLASQMRIQSTSCTTDGQTGTVRNGSEVTVDLTIETQFTRDGVLVDTGFDSISRLAPGQTAEWETRFFASSEFDRCNSEITSARES